MPDSHIVPFIQKGFKILQYMSWFKPSGLYNEVERVKQNYGCLQ